MVNYAIANGLNYMVNYSVIFMKLSIFELCLEGRCCGGGGVRGDDR